MLNFISTTLNPERYHGHNARPPFFEGWYYKLIDPSEHYRYAIIPGVSLGTGGDGPHAFIQVINGTTGETAYHVYPLEDFWTAERTHYVQIGPNHFTTASMKLDLPKQALSLSGEVIFYDLVPWPKTLWSPSIMGWYAWIPKMECYHSVLSLDHTIHGTLRINDTPVTFTGGRGYIEKDWGRSFPSAWIWMQSNHFEDNGTGITASMAMIPWIGKMFPGFIVGFLHQGILYRFATYTGAVVESLEITPTQVIWTLRDALYRLRLTAQREETGILRGPNPDNMERRVPETLKATVSVQLSTRQGDCTIFEGTGRNAGMEIVGKVETLLT